MSQLLLLACTVILVLAPTILNGYLCRQAVMVARPAPSQQVCWKPFERSKETWSQEILKPHHSCLQYDTQHDIPQPDCTIESPCKLPSSLNNVTDMTNCRTYSDCNSGHITVYESLTSAEQRQPDAEELRTSPNLRSPPNNTHQRQITSHKHCQHGTTYQDHGTTM